MASFRPLSLSFSSSSSSSSSVMGHEDGFRRPLCKPARRTTSVRPARRTTYVSVRELGGAQISDPQDQPPAAREHGVGRRELDTWRGRMMPYMDGRRRAAPRRATPLAAHDATPGCLSVRPVRPSAAEKGQPAEARALPAPPPDEPVAGKGYPTV
jgi:hypothetical protein